MLVSPPHHQAFNIHRTNSVHNFWTLQKKAFSPSCLRRLFSVTEFKQRSSSNWERNLSPWTYSMPRSVNYVDYTWEKSLWLLAVCPASCRIPQADKCHRILCISIHLRSRKSNAIMTDNSPFRQFTTRQRVIISASRSTWIQYNSAFYWNASETNINHLNQSPETQFQLFGNHLTNKVIQSRCSWC